MVILNAPAARLRRLCHVLDIVWHRGLVRRRPCGAFLWRAVGRRGCCMRIPLQCICRISLTPALLANIIDSGPSHTLAFVSCPIDCRRLLGDKPLRIGCDRLDCSWRRSRVDIAALLRRA
jgi:hypothetical protein